MIDLTLIKTSEDFELFCEDLLKAIGFSIESRPSRGPGQGKDIICLRYCDDEFDGRQIQRFLVECKHFATSGKSVYEDDTKNIVERAIRNECDHYLLITSTIAGVTVRDHIEAINRNERLNIRATSWYKTDLVKRIYENPVVWKWHTGHEIPSSSQPKLFNTLVPFLKCGSRFCPNESDFANGLYYVSELDLHLIQKIREVLVSNQHRRLSILSGPPASGKTVLSIVLANHLEAHGITTYFHRLTANSPVRDIYREILDNDNPGNLFVFDNCHLNLDALNYIYANFNSVHNAACLFVTRDISEKARFSSEFDNLDVLERLSEETFKLAVGKDARDKIVGIIANYKGYYERLYGREYLIGNEDKVINNTRGNLLALYYLLKLWPDIERLDLVDINSMLKEIYNRYLTHPTGEVLLKYAALYQFEIDIEPLQCETPSAELLLSHGLLSYDVETEYYSFYHSDFAKLLIESYQSRPSFYRNYEDLDDFTYRQLSNYLSAFKRRPSNVHDLVCNLISNQKSNLLQRLLRDSCLMDIFISYYCSKGSVSEISSFLWSVFNFDPSLSKVLAHKLVQPTLATKALYLEAEFMVLVKTILVLEKTGQSHCEEFLNMFSDIEINTIILRSSLLSIARAISLLNPEHTLRDRSIKLITPETVTEKTVELNLRDLILSFSMLSKIDPQMLKHALENLHSEQLAGLAKKEYFSDIAHCLSTLRKFNKDKAMETYACIPHSLMVLKGKESGLTFIGLARGLSDLSKVDFDKTVSIFESIGLNAIVRKAIDPNMGFPHIALGLVLLSKISHSKSRQLLNSLDSINLVSLANRENISSFSQAINEINIINPKVARSVLSGIDISTIINNTDVGMITINSFAKSLSELSNLDMEKSWDLLDRFESSDLVNRIGNDIDTLPKLGNTLSVFRKIDPMKSKSILKQISISELLAKVESVGFPGIALGISSLNKIDPKKIEQLLSLLGIPFFVKKAEDKRVTFIALATGLSMLKSVNSVLAANIFRSMDLELIREKAMKHRRKYSMNERPFNVLPSLDRQRALDIGN